MMENTGIVYPTLELGGKTYTVKFTRGELFYRMSKLGSSFADLNTHGKNFAALIDCLHAALVGYKGSPEELAEAVMKEDKTESIGTVIAEALKKASPPTQVTAEVTAGPPAVQ